jgi:ectoine hydroxylase-related dioxygenase (phytanoyl-CoA dioxygenase family)
LKTFDKKTANELPKGYASFHHPLTMHGSYENSSERPRRAVVINAMADGTLGNTAGYYRQDALKTFPAMPQDELLDSKFFPLLFDGDKKLESLGRAIPKVDVKEMYGANV